MNVGSAGGILTIVSGCLGLLGALLTSFVGIMIDSFTADPTVSELGAVGFVGSVIVLGLGATGLMVKRLWVGFVVIVFALITGLSGGTVVFACMIPGVVGGIMLVVGRKQQARVDTGDSSAA